MQNDDPRHIASSLNAPLLVSCVKTEKQVEIVKLSKSQLHHILFGRFLAFS